MRIEVTEEEAARLRRSDQIRNIQKYQQSQDKLEAEEVKAKAGKKKKPDAQPASGEHATSSIRVPTRDAPSARRVEERAEATVKNAHKSLKAGENWQAFSDRVPHDKSPTSINQLAREEVEKADRKHEEKKVMSARELQNDLAVTKKQIRG